MNNNCTFYSSSFDTNSDLFKYISNWMNMNSNCNNMIINVKNICPSKEMIMKLILLSSWWLRITINIFLNWKWEQVWELDSSYKIRICRQSKSIYFSLLKISKSTRWWSYSFLSQYSWVGAGVGTATGARIRNGVSSGSKLRGTIIFYIIFILYLYQESIRFFTHINLIINLVFNINTFNN